MNNDPKPQATATPTNAASWLSAGLGATELFVCMNNAELEDAIEATYTRLQQTGSILEHYRALQSHLSELLAIQRARAAYVQIVGAGRTARKTPNAELRGDGPASPARRPA